MANKQIANFGVGGAKLTVAVFDKTEVSDAGECAVVMSVWYGGASAEVRAYASPAELLALGHSIIDAAMVAEKVANSGELPE